MTTESKKNLPISRNRRGAYREFAKECKGQPGLWFRAPREFANKNQASSFASSLRRGELADFRPKGEWEVAQRKPSEEFQVWIRFVGEGQA